MQHRLKKAREETVERVYEGLRDGGHVYPKCSNCSSLLMDIHITRPHEPEVWKVRATCPFCGDSSFIEEIKGGFHYGGYGTSKEDDPNDDIPSTLVDHFDIVGDTFLFVTMKASPDAKPVRR